MPNIPCPIKIVCPDDSTSDLEFDFPLANFSSEAPDPELFIGINYGWDFNIPRLGWTWDNLNFPGLCENPVSQAEADFCAARQNINNVTGLLNWKKQTGVPPTLYGNTVQTCTFTCPDGLPFIWTVGAGFVTDLNQSRADSIARSMACQQAALHHICMSSIGNGCLQVPYSATITPAGGTAPYTFDVVGGSLPPGLTLSPSATSVVISGAPSQAGEFTFTIRATDKDGNFMQKPYVVEILGITNVSGLPHPVANRAYSEQLTVSGGFAPYTFSIINGSLPAGLTLSASGLISGTPTVHYSGAFIATFQVTDSTGMKCSSDWNSVVDEPPGPDWTQLNWTAYPLIQGNPANTVSGAGNQATAFGSLTCNTNAANPKIVGVAASGVSYTGGIVNCRLQLVITATPSGNNTMTCRILRNGVQIPGAGYAQPFNAPGTYNFDFAVPASVAAAFTIDDASPGNNWALITASGFAGTPMHLDFTWTVFNL